jgi:hypothetical protein
MYIGSWLLVQFLVICIYMLNTYVKYRLIKTRNLGILINQTDLLQTASQVWLINPILYLQVKNKPHDEMQFVQLFLNQVCLRTIYF